MTSLPVHHNPAAPAAELRPVNLRTDLAPLADLIELSFASSMDSSGRAAIREMRTLSRMGAGLGIISGISEMATGIGMGYVWIADGQLVGNVSVYPASWPRDAGKAWIIANVAVHPDHRGKGIARRLMQASMEMVSQRGGDCAILQVDTDNPVARGLYTRLGFREERTWTTWRRTTNNRIPQPSEKQAAFIARRRDSEWRAEYALAEKLRPTGAGGLGWLRPLHPNLFRRSILGQLSDWFNLRSLERLVIRADNQKAIAASLWIETGFGVSTSQLTLLVEPQYRGWYDFNLLDTAVRRMGRNHALATEHPEDDESAPELFQHYGFQPRRSVIHMRWDLPHITTGR